MSTFRIQEFASLGGVTVRALNHYDRLSSDPRVKKAFFIVEQNGAQLAELATLFGSGDLKCFCQSRAAARRHRPCLNGAITGPPGKIVILTQ
ncbi:MAG TPA: hypothetical protein VJV22_13430, partial [Acidobacteriaceae bacterium]|nr:hypothetical protein [Acidobacteriaceae bacterium]